MLYIPFFKSPIGQNYEVMTFYIQKANFTAKHFLVIIQRSIAQEQQCNWCMEAYSNNSSLIIAVYTTSWKQSHWTELYK